MSTFNLENFGPILSLILFCIFAYLVGSISSAIIVCRLTGLPDPRTVGSKNPGATNVLRLGGKKAALLTLVGDVLKGVVPVLVAMFLDPRPIVIGLVMVAVFLGHLYPIFFGFRGGKGVATAFGAIATFSWLIGLLLIATWGIMFLLFRISSLAALVTAVLAPIYVFLLEDPFYVWPVTCMSLLLIWRHRTNVKKLIEGKEEKMF